MSKNMKIGLSAGAGLFFCLVCLLGAVGVTLFMTQNFEDVGDTLMEAMRDKDYEGIWNTFHPTLREETGSAELVWWNFHDQDLIPAAWSYTFREVGEDGVGRLHGPVTFQDGSEGVVFILLEEVDGQWLVKSFALEGNLTIDE